MQRVCLLTGRPGTGKTSLIREIVSGLKGRAGGFYTEEIRGQGKRLGFRLVTLDGREAVLAHTSFHSPFRVSRYGVDVEDLDSIGVSALEQAARDSDLIVVDEIGKMELFSDRFRETVRQLVAGDKLVLGTVMLSSNPFADAIKRMPQVRTVNVTRDNHPQVAKEIAEWLKANGYARAS